MLEAHNHGLLGHVDFGQVFVLRWPVRKASGPHRYCFDTAELINCKHGYICLVQNLDVTGLASPLVASAFSRKILSLRPSPKHPSTRKGEKSTSVTQGTQRTEWFCILILRRNVVSTIKQRTLSVQAVPGAFFFTQQTTVTIITAVFQRRPCVFSR